MDNELKENSIYEFKHENKNLSKEALIKESMDTYNIKNLIAYIQNRYQDIFPQGMLTALDLQRILKKCYGIESIFDAEAEEEVDLQLDYKKNLNKMQRDNILSNYKKYEVKGFTGELRKIVDLEIEQWR